jgi:hypothetical protein
MNSGGVAELAGRVRWGARGFDPYVGLRFVHCSHPCWPVAPSGEVNDDARGGRLGPWHWSVLRWSSCPYTSALPSPVRLLALTYRQPQAVLLLLSC